MQLILSMCTILSIGQDSGTKDNSDLHKTIHSTKIFQFICMYDDVHSGIEAKIHTRGE